MCWRWPTTTTGSSRYRPTKRTARVSATWATNTHGEHARRFALANWIRTQGYSAHAFPGPSGNALLLIPPAIAAGLGELGEHGSLISRRFGAGVRLAGVTTNMPLVQSVPDQFGADEFCQSCQICTKGCPPGAISAEKQLVRGVDRWYVDFDKCIPYFAEASGCGICIAICPWTKPTIRPKLLSTMQRRLGSAPSEK